MGISEALLRDLLSPAFTSESARCVCFEPHFGHSAAGLALIVRNSFSKRWPQDWHVNSYTGM